jgi:hypothetical protein
VAMMRTLGHARSRSSASSAWARSGARSCRAEAPGRSCSRLSHSVRAAADRISPECRGRRQPPVPPALARAAW